MQVGKISQNTNFGTKCYIGELGANLTLKQYNKKLTAGIMDAFNKLSKNGNKDILSLNLGKPKDFPFCTMNLSFFSKEGNYQSSMNILPDTLCKTSKNKISKFIQKQYSKLKESTHKACDITFFADKKSQENISIFHQKNIINELCNKYGADDSHLFVG